MKELFGNCQYLDAHRILTGKWSIFILYLLTEKPLRFNEMLRRMPEPMTASSLSNQLKALEKQKLILRTDYRENPPRVEYSLTPIAAAFQPVLDTIQEWGLGYLAAVRDMRWPEQSEVSAEEMLREHICEVIRLTNRMLTGRWTMSVMYSLEKKPLRFHELQQKFNGAMTPKSLSKSLRFLEGESMIKRTIRNEMPIQVEYSQTSVGSAFKDVLNAIALWCESYREQQRMGTPGGSEKG